MDRHALALLIQAKLAHPSHVGVTKSQMVIEGLSVMDTATIATGCSFTLNASRCGTWSAKSSATIQASRRRPTMGETGGLRD